MLTAAVVFLIIKMPEIPWPVLFTTIPADVVIVCAVCGYNFITIY